MLLNIGSLILILVLTGTFFLYVSKNSDRLSQRSQSIAAAVMVAVSCFASGLVAAKLLDLPLLLLFGIVILYAVLVGLVSGRFLSKQIAINNALAGWLGALLGTLLGSLFYKATTIVLVADVAFVLFVLLMQKMLERFPGQQKRTKKGKKQAAKPSRIGTMLLSLGVVVTSGIILLQYDQIPVGHIGQPQTQHETLDEKNDLQVATIEVTAGGLVPKVTEFQSGSMIKAIFDVKQNAGSGLKLISKGLNFSADLKPGQNVFLLNNPQPGTYDIVVNPKSYKGTFTVKKVK